MATADAPAANPPADTPWRLATFSADVTIPMGHRCMGVLPTKSKEVVDPLQAHGLVLLGKAEPIVLVAIDWCEIRNDSFDLWREALADAADTSPQRVLVCSVHQHDAPVIDHRTQQLLTEAGLEGELFDVDFHAECVQRVGQALTDCLDTARPVTHIGLGEARVDRVTSNRRVVHLDGRVSFSRSSGSGGDPFMADAPTGLIDPMLKTISFFDGDEPLVAVSSYSVHPMSYYGRGGVSYDFVGMAREQRRDDSGIPQIYLTGCSGDTTAGKYNDASVEMRPVLAERLREAMERAWASTQRHPLEQIDLRVAELNLPFHEGDDFTADALAATIRDTDAPMPARILAAMGLASRMRLDEGRPIDLPCLDFGPAQMVFLPGEAFVGYQVMAQQMRPDVMVMAIGFCECWPGYIPTASVFADGFHHGWRWVGRGSEAAIRGALQLVQQSTTSAMEQSGKWDQINLPEDVRAQCLDVLRRGIQAEEFWPAMHAAEALTLAGYGDEVVEQLAPRLPKESDDQRRCGLARELVRAGQKRYAAVMLDILAQDDPYAHVHAAESLYKVGEIGDGRAMRRAADRDDNKVLQLMACGALARCGNPDALEVIREAVGVDDQDTVRIAAWLLGRVGKAADIPRLKTALESATQPLARAFIEHSLAALGDPSGLAALEKNLDSDDTTIRAMAATFAGEARATGLASKLIAQLDDPEFDPRVRAAQTLLVLDNPPPPGWDTSPADEHISYLLFKASEQYPRYTEGSIIELADGALLFAISRFERSTSDFAKAKIIGRTSRDGGRTWSEPRILQDNVGKLNVMSVTLRRLGPPNQWTSPIGMFYLVKDSHSSLNVYLRVSEDEGQTFGEPIRVSTESGYNVMNNDRVARLSTGRLLAPVAFTEDVSRVNHFVSFCYISDDNGATWRRGKGRMDQPKRGAMEPEVIELKDGRVMMIARTQLGHIAAAISTDGGDTWGEPFKLSVTAPEAPSMIRRVPATGDLLLVWNNTFTPGAGHGGRRTPLTTALSSDEGKTWHHVRNLEDDPAHTYSYPSLTFVGTRAVMSYWESGPGGGQLSTRYRSLPTGWFHGKPSGERPRP